MKEKEQNQLQCFNCNQFFPLFYGEPTEYGVCLLEPALDPYLEDILEDLENAPCQDLLHEKRFSGNTEVCENFEEIEEGFELKDDYAFVEELKEIVESGEEDPERVQEALTSAYIRHRFRTDSVEGLIEAFDSGDLEAKKKTVHTLGGLICFDNKEAFEALLNFFKRLPPPSTIEEVHFKMEVLNELSRSQTKSPLIPILIQELYDVRSNNTTKQWVTKILRFLNGCPLEETREPLEKLLKESNLTYRRKDQIKTILHGGSIDRWFW